MDPQLHHQIFAYRSNGIRGYPAWDPRWGKAPAPAPGKLPLWTPPRLVTRSGRPIAVVLADGQRVQITSDGRGRVVRLGWATPRGEPLVTTVRYESRETTVSAPAGVVRTYHYDDRRLITEVDAPGAAAHARKDTVGGLLDSKATERRLAYRLRSGTQERYAAYGVAPNAITENYLDEANTDGYQRYGVPTLADMRRVDDALRRSGVLDVAEAIPTLNDRVETYTVEKPFEQVTKGLHSCRFETSYFGVTYARTITPDEIASVARRLPSVPKTWVYLYYHDADSLCLRLD
jgi:YD repeat-containing protein